MFWLKNSLKIWKQVEYLIGVTWKKNEYLLTFTFKKIRGIFFYCGKSFTLQQSAKAIGNTS